MSPSPGNKTEISDNRTLLRQMNDDMFASLMPVVVFLVMLMLVGTIGNILVIYVYGWRLKSTTQNFLFTWMAVTDLMKCLLGLPFEIVDLRNEYLYENSAACKLMRFLLVLLTLMSVNLLTCIAVDRYRRVCKPLYRQIEKYHAKIGLLLSSLVALIVAGPALFLYGLRTVNTLVGVRGQECSVQDKHNGQPFHIAYQVAEVTIFVFFLATLVYLYRGIWVEISRHKNYLVQCVSTINLPEQSFVNNETETAAKKRGQLDRFLTFKLISSNKPIAIALAVTVVFVVSYLPYVCLMAVSALIPDMDQMQPGSSLVLYQLGLKLHFISSVSGVFIYGAMSEIFRRQVKTVFCKTNEIQLPNSVSFQMCRLDQQQNCYQQMQQ